ncbi:MAG TPA: secretin N-terminal domain-containing protein [Thermoanaerobaculia bacterium]|nr:secretin N-terminal domain-containing protein [Thermoanaerobaculia bacterium]
MNRNRLKVATTLLLLLPLLSCTSFRSYQSAKDFEEQGKWDEAIVEYQKALEVDPNNVRYKMALDRSKLEASRAHFEKGKSLRAAAIEARNRGEAARALQLNELALVEFELVVRLDSTNQFAAVEYAKVVSAIQEAMAVANGPTFEERKRAVVTKAQPPQLNPTSLEPISLSFPRPTPIKDIYRSLGNAFGINIIFDQGVKDEERISIELRDVTAQQALERVMQAGNQFYKVLDEKTLIVIPDTPQTRRDYEDLVIRTFYLSNGDAEQVTNVVRTMIEARNVFPLKALNAITIRDTADKVRIAEKIIEANDKARAEVVVQVELLQVDARKLRDIGLKLGAYSTSGALSDAAGGTIGSLPYGELGNIALNDFNFTIPTLSYTLLKNNTDARLLARPQLRISEGEDATLHIGQKQPIPVSTLFTNVGVGGGFNQGPITSFQYQDVGIKIAITPRVHHNREVSLKLTVEVSNIAGFVPGGGENSPDQPIIGTRTIQSTIRLKDGETNLLAGLIREDDSITKDDIPFLSDLPVIGRLFSREQNNVATTDVVLTMTPHIIRIPDITDEDLAPMWVGTTNNLTFRGVSPRLESNVQADPFNNVPRTTTATQENPPPSQEFFAPGQVPATQPPPSSPVPPATGPSDVFRQQPQPPPPGGGANEPQTPGVQPPPPGASSMNQEDYRLKFAPRIAPQPSKIAIGPGEEKVWSIVAMDVAGLAIPQMVLHYDPLAMDIAGFSLGTALEINPEVPPVVSIDRANGTIRISSSDGSMLQFRSGGEVVAFRVRGGVTGDTMLVIEPLAFSQRNGERVDVAVAGGSARVE